MKELNVEVLIFNTNSLLNVICEVNVKFRIWICLITIMLWKIIAINDSDSLIRSRVSVPSNWMELQIESHITDLNAG